MGSWAQNRLTILSVRLIKVNAPARPMLKVYFCTMKQQRSTIFLMLSSLLSIGYLMPVVVRAFFKPLPEGSEVGIKEASPAMLVPLTLTALGSLALFFFAPAIRELLLPMVGG